MSVQRSDLQLTWREIREHALNCCGQTSEAGVEFFHLVTAANRELFTLIDDVPEAEKDNVPVVLRPGDSRFPTPPDLFAYTTVYNVTESTRVEPEEDGRHGRSKYLDDSGEPREGIVYRYVRSGRWTLVRDAAEEKTDLLLSYRYHPVNVTKGMLDDHPLTPPQYDWAIVYLTAAHYYQNHPPTEDQIQAGVSAPYYRQSANLQISGQQVIEPKHPKAHETRDDRARLTTRGYSVGGFGR